MTAIAGQIVVLGLDQWPAWLIVAAVGAWLTLDETALAQTWLAQPLPAAIIAGLLTGDPAAGLLVGLPFQLATLGNLPVGQSFLGDKAAPTVGVVAAAAGGLGGQAAAPWSLDPAVAARVGWLLVLLAVASIVGHQAVKLERALHVRWSASAMRSLRDGNTSRLDAVQGRSLGATAARGAISALLWAWIAGTWWLPALDAAPAFVTETAAMIPVLTPALAVGALAELYGSRRGMRWFAGGLLAVLAAAWLMALGGGGS